MRDPRLVTLHFLIEHRWLAAALLGLLVVVAVWVGLRLRARIGVRRTRRAAQGRLGEPFDGFDAGTADSVVTLRGTLASQGDPVPSFVDTREVAAVSLLPVVGGVGSHRSGADAVIHHRSERIVVRTKNKEVELVGPIEVAVGSRHGWSGRRLERADSMVRAHVSEDVLIRSHWELMGRHGGHARTLDDGDEVLVRGKLSKLREHGDAAAYRDAATRWGLSAADGEAACVAAHTKRPSVGWPRRAFIPVVLVGFGLFLSAGTYLELRHPALGREAMWWCHDACTQDGNCYATFEGVLGMDYGCIAANQGDCRASSGCTKQGRCTLADDACVIASEDDCRGSGSCKEEGLCAFEADKCVARSADDCERSQDCADFAQCALRDGECVATAASCAKGIRCKHLGQCTLVDTSCRAATDDDCKESKLCHRQQQCSAHDGNCVRDAKACASHRWCAEEGLCTYDAKKDECVFVGEADCRRTYGCRDSGRCSFYADNGRTGCVVGRHEDCSSSEACSIHGRCIADPVDGRRCGASTDELCAKTDACRIDGDCAVVDYWCNRLAGPCHACGPTKQRHCDQATKCKQGGCVLEEGACRARSGRENCALSIDCRDDGECTTSEDGSYCKVASDDDCRKSRACTRDGRCEHWKGRCYAPKPFN